MERLSQYDMRAVPLSHRAVSTDCAVLFVAEVCEGRVVELPKRIEGIKCRGHDGTGDLLMRQALIVNNAVDDAERQQIGGRELKRLGGLIRTLGILPQDRRTGLGAHD